MISGERLDLRLARRHSRSHQIGILIEPHQAVTEHDSEPTIRTRHQFPCQSLGDLRRSADNTIGGHLDPLTMCLHAFVRSLLGHEQTRDLSRFGGELSLRITGSQQSAGRTETVSVTVTPNMTRCHFLDHVGQGTRIEIPGVRMLVGSRRIGQSRGRRIRCLFIPFDRGEQVWFERIQIVAAHQTAIPEQPPTNGGPRRRLALVAHAVASHQFAIPPVNAVHPLGTTFGDLTVHEAISHRSGSTARSMTGVDQNHVDPGIHQ